MNPKNELSELMIIDRLQLINNPHILHIEDLAILLYDLYSATNNILQGYIIYLDSSDNIVIRSRKLDTPIIIYFPEALLWSIAHLPLPLPNLVNITNTLNACFGEESELKQHFPDLPSTHQFVQLGIEAYEKTWITPLDLSYLISDTIP